MITRATCVAVMLVVSGGTQADICRWTDAAGAVHYGDRAPSNVTAHCDRPPPKKAPAPPVSTYRMNPELAQIAEKFETARTDAQARFEATLSRARWFKAREGSR